MAGEINWALANTQAPEQIAAAAPAGALQGLDLGQKMATLKALRGTDLSDPSSVDSAMTGLIHAGATDQATALGNLNFTRSLRSMAPAIMDRLSKLGGDQQQPPTTMAPSDPNAPASLSPEQQAHAAETLQGAQAAAQTLLNTPITERPAAFAKIKADMVARGVPEAAIDAAGEDLSDQGLTALQQHYAQLATHIGGQGQAPADGAAPAAAPGLHPTTYSWAKQLLSDPSMQMGVGMLKGAGLDMSGLVDTAKGLVQPELQAQTNLAYAPQQAAATSAATAPLDVIQTTIHGVPVQMNRAEFLKLQQSGVPGVGTGLSPEEAARQTAAGGAAGGAPYDIIHTKLNGVDVDLPKSAFLALQAAGTQGLGRGLSPGDAAFQTGDAGNYTKALEGATDQSRQLTLQRGAQTGQQIMGLADTVNTGKYGPSLSGMAQTLGPLLGGDIKKYATNADLLQQDLTDAVRTQISGSGLPRIKSEFDQLSKAFPTISSTPGRIQLTGAYMTAASKYEQNFDRYLVERAADPNSPKSLASVTAAWNNGPGKVSLFADPVFRNLKINGEPAVVFSPDGKWGVFMPGTKSAQTFRAK